jgi:WhiB family redox-sensing transcriptional regulator
VTGSVELSGTTAGGIGAGTEWSGGSPLIAPEPWMQDAACTSANPEAWFPEKGGSTRDAKRVCDTCDVVAECLAYALERDERFGIWGGKSERERRKLKREMSS